MALDIHHIFPQDWCEKKGNIPRKLYNTVVNKTPISYKANRMVGGSAPSQYLQKIQKHPQVLIGDADMNAILVSHFIPADTLRADDFAGFYQARKQNLLVLIEKAMGKQTVAVALPEEGEETEIEETDEDS